MERPALQKDTVLSRTDAWHREPQARLAVLRQELAQIQLHGSDDDVLLKRRYIVTFRRQHRI